MFRKSFAVLLALASTQAMAVVSVCSIEFLPEAGGNAVRHEALWDYYDNWNFDLQVLVTTQVQGPVSVDEGTVYSMGNGGHSIHYLPQPPNGNLLVQGGLQLGYLTAHGFDAYQFLDCISWQGVVEPAPDTVESTDGSLAGGAGATPDDMNAAACLINDAPCAATRTALTQEVDGSAEDARNGNGLFVAAGMIQAVDDRGIVLRTEVGRYITLLLPTATKMTRLTSFSVGDAKLVEGDQIGVLSTADRHEIRVYRNVLWSGAEQRAAASAKLPEGVESRGVLKSVEQDSRGSVLHLIQGSNEQLHRSATEHTVVTIIEPAVLEELLPFSGVARVLAEQQKDGTLVARSIEILQ